MRRPLGALLLLIGLVTGAMYLYTLIDPVSAQLANDNDPFGTPPPAWQGWLGVIVSIGMGAAGAWLMRRPRVPRRPQVPRRVGGREEFR